MRRSVYAVLAGIAGVLPGGVIAQCAVPEMTAERPAFYVSPPYAPAYYQLPKVPECLTRHSATGRHNCEQDVIEDYFAAVTDYIAVLRDYAEQSTEFAREAARQAKDAQAYARAAERFQNDAYAYMRCATRQAQRQHQ